MTEPLWASERLVELEAQANTAWRAVELQIERINELEAQLAGTWQPVDHIMREYPDGKQALIYTNNDSYERAQLRYYPDATQDNPTEMIVVLPDDLRLCQRTTPQEPTP